MTHQFMRAFVGGFLRLPPVKKTLMSDMFRSRFLDTIKREIKKKGRKARRRDFNIAADGELMFRHRHTFSIMGNME